MRQQLASFALRFLLNTVGLWVAVRLVGTGYSDQVTHNLWVFVGAGLLFSILNAVLKPLLVILSLPAILVTLGLFTILLNGFLVYLALALAPGIKMAFWHSVFAGLVLSLVNYIVTAMLELRRHQAMEKEQER